MSLLRLVVLEVRRALGARGNAHLAEVEALRDRLGELEQLRIVGRAELRAGTLGVFASRPGRRQAEALRVNTSYCASQASEGSYP